MTFTEGETANLISKRLESGIYHFILLQATRTTIDEWVERIREIWTLHGQTRQPISIFIENCNAANIPINYAFRQGMQLVAKFPNLPKGRTAFILDDTVLIGIVNSFLRLMPVNVETRFFPQAQRDRALAWLEEHLTNER